MIGVCPARSNLRVFRLTRMEPVSILLIEDDRIIAEDIRMMLANHGYKVTLGYPEILQRYPVLRDSIDSVVAESHIGLVLMDIDLRSEFDGVDVAKHLQSILNIPLIYITGQADPPTVLRAKGTRPSAYLLKPFTPLQLLTQVKTVLENFAAQADKAKVGVKNGLWQLQTAPAGIRTSFSWLSVFGFDENQVRSEEDFFHIVHPEDRTHVREVISIMKRKLVTKRVFEYRIIDPRGVVRHVYSRFVDSRKALNGEFTYSILSVERSAALPPAPSPARVTLRSESQSGAADHF